MNRGNIFTTYPENFEKNYNDGENLRVVKSRMLYLEGGKRGTAPGVVVFVNDRVTLALTEDHALKLANGIADALESEPE